jgi:hypothetical protein
MLKRPRVEGKPDEKPKAAVTPLSHVDQNVAANMPQRCIGGIAPPPHVYTPSVNSHSRPSSACKSVVQPQSAREQRRSEYVDRWLEKLYFRNPVVVKPKDTNPAETAVVTAADVRTNEEVVAQLPPKPRSRNASRIRQEIVQERLLQCFSTGQMTSDVWRCPSRPSSSSAPRSTSAAARMRVLASPS